MNLQNQDFQKKLSKSEKQFSINQIIIWSIVILALLIMLKRIFDFRKRNKTLTQKLESQLTD